MAGLVHVARAALGQWRGWKGAAWCAVAALSVTFAFLAGADNGRRPFKIYDEPHTGERSREMLVTGDFLSVRTNFTPQFKKPPLHYWLTAGALALMDDRMAAARLWSLLFGAGSIMATAWVASGVVGRGAVLAPVVSAVLVVSCVHLWRSSGAALLDTGMAFFALAGVGCLLRAPADSRWWTGWGAACACGALHKAGLALPYGALVVAALWSEFAASRFWRTPSFWLGLCIAAAGFVFWPIVQVVRFGPEVLDVFVRGEVVERVLGGEDNAYRSRPGYVLTDLWLSWPLVGAAGIAWLALGWHRGLRASSRRALAIWLIGAAMFLLLTLMSKKVARYTLALVPWISIGLAVAVEGIRDPRARTAIAGACALLLALPFAASGAGLPYPKARDSTYRKELVRFLKAAHREREVVVLGVDSKPLRPAFVQRLLFESGIDGPIRHATSDTAEAVLAAARAEGRLLVVAEGDALAALMRAGASEPAPAFGSWRFWRSR